MAEGTRLQIKFETMAGLKTWNINYAKPSMNTADVKALMNGMIQNGSIFEYPPIRAYSAKTITTSENEFDLT